MNDQKLKPPRWLLRFFRWYCHPDYREDIEGDLMERFEKRLEEKTTRVAKWGFTKDVIQLFRPGIIRSLEGNYRLNQYGMFKHNLKIASRSLLGNKAFSFINIFGLVLGMSAFILILNYVIVELSYDKFHKNGEQIYRIRNDHFSKGSLTYSRAITYRDAGPSLKEDLPEVLDFTRMNGSFGRGIVLTNVNEAGKSIKFTEEEVFYVDDNFLTIFSFPLIKGDSSQVLKDPNSVVVTETLSNKYFGNEDPIGKIITVNGNQSFHVTGVLNDIPSNSHMKFDLLFPIKSLNEYQNRTARKWCGAGGDVAYTYIRLHNDIDPAVLEEKFPAFLKNYQSEFAAESGLTDQFILQPLQDIHLHSDLGFEMSINGNANTVMFLIIIASIVLFIAWINYINLSSVKTTQRAREVGVRKVVGATKKQVAKQFLTEALLLNFIAIVLSIIVVFISFPVFKKITGLENDFVILNNFDFLIYLIVFLLFGAIISGLYPAFIMSSFKSLVILKGQKNQKVQGISLVKGLTLFQYAISVALITGTLAVFKQVDFMLDEDLGIEVDQVVVTRAPQITKDNYFTLLKSFRTEMLRHPDFIEMSASSEVPGKAFNTTSWIGPSNASFEQLKLYSSAWVDYNFLPLFSLNLLSGRNFSEAFPTDENAILVNEEFVRALGFQKPEDAVDQPITSNRGNMKIVGVVENYHHVSLKNTIEPAVFFLNSERNRKFISFKMNTQNLTKAVNVLKKEYEAMFPNDPFEFFFLDEHFDQQYKADKQHGKVFTLFTVLAIFITCLGLFNLSFITTLNRTKEIAVRKVLGATASNIFMLISMDFIKLIVIGTLIGIPLIWVILQEWLSNFAFRIDISFRLLVAPVVLILIIAGFTLSYHILKAALTNPANSLRSE